MTPSSLVNRSAPAVGLRLLGPDGVAPPGSLTHLRWGCVSSLQTASRLRARSQCSWFASPAALMTPPSLVNRSAPAVGLRLLAPDGVAPPGSLTVPSQLVEVRFTGDSRNYVRVSTLL